MWGSLILYLLMLAIAVVSIKNKKNIIQKLGFKKTDVKQEGYYAIITLILLLITSIVLGILFVLFGLEKDASIVSETIKSVPLFQVLIVLTIGSIVEEIFFRGYLQRKTNLLTTSFIFGYFHIIYGSLTEVIGAFFLGLVLGHIYNKRKNLFAPALAHIFYNLIAVMAIYSLA